jgi:hypothetical protein
MSISSTTRKMNPPEIPFNVFNKSVCHCIGDGRYRLSYSIRNKGKNT